jgi:hypothetical protein
MSNAMSAGEMSPAEMAQASEMIAACAASDYRNREY